MKYVFSGLVAGFLLAFAPFLMKSPSYTINAEWNGQLSNSAMTQTSMKDELKKGEPFIIREESKIDIIGRNGAFIRSANFLPEELFSMSGNGKFYAKYTKLGKEVEYYNINGERFWKAESGQYPYVSYNGKLVLLLVADLSNVLIRDNNGNEIGSKQVSGRFCTNIAFSNNNDYAAISFIDGHFYVLNEKGEVTHSGESHELKPIKSIAISENGKFVALHSGDTEKDFISVVNLEKKKISSSPLKNVHRTKTAIYVNDEGYASIINQDSFITVNKKAKIEFAVNIDLQRAGSAKIIGYNDIYSITYRAADGGSKIYFFDKDGFRLYTYTFQDEYLDQNIADNVILLRGLDNLYCLSVAR